MRELLEKMIAEHTGKTPEEVSRDIERDKILTADAALEYGLIDSILESRKAVPVWRQPDRSVGRASSCHPPGSAITEYGRRTCRELGVQSGVR